MVMRPGQRSRFSSAFATAIAALSLAACSAPDEDAANEPENPNHLTVYSSVAQTTAEKINDGFIKANPEVTISLNRLSGASGEADTVFVTEALHGGSPADIVFGSTPVVVRNHPQFYAKLEEIGVEGLDRLPASARNERYIIGIDGMWGVGYDTEEVAPEDVPHSWPDVLNPKFKGKCVILEMRGKNVGLVSWALRLQDRYGDEFLRKLAAQDCLVADTGQLAGQIIAAGGAVIGFPFFPSHVNPTRNAGAPIDYQLLTDPLIGVSKYIEIPQDAPNRDLAVKMMNWLLTDEGQSASCGDNTYGSPMRGIPGCVAAPDLPLIGPDWDLSPEKNEELSRLLGMED